MAKEMIAMLLAGGQGSRLYALTQKLAKPAVPFGGKYRIIDFPLSNCVNSGIDTVGVLTQYQPLVLNEYIGNGQPWDLDRLHGGVHILQPYQQASGSDWYKGTANAIYQNIPFIERYNPQYVIILSGDQICKQDYSDFLRFHKEKNAEFSVAVMEVPWEEASRFGLMVADENDRITEFQEKPKNPKSNLASMGIYIFNWDILKRYLIEDEADPESENDFGNNIIPNLLRDGRSMYAYHFNGYWKDVGTIASLWEANMEVLDPEHSGINLFDNDWKIYSRNSGMTGHKICGGRRGGKFHDYGRLPYRRTCKAFHPVCGRSCGEGRKGGGRCGHGRYGHKGRCRGEALHRCRECGDRRERCGRRHAFRK